MEGEKMTHQHVHEHIYKFSGWDMNNVQSNLFIQYLRKPNKKLLDTLIEIYNLFKP